MSDLGLHAWVDESINLDVAPQGIYVEDESTRANVIDAIVGWIWHLVVGRIGVDPPRQERAGPAKDEFAEVLRIAN